MNPSLSSSIQCPLLSPQDVSGGAVEPQEFALVAVASRIVAIATHFMRSQ
jgi:hypothetical protein